MITVITPTYNRAQYLGQAVDSVLAQTYTDWELLVVDDNKPDSEARKATDEVMAHYTDPRIHYIQNEKNIGGAAARNVGIFQAKSEYIAFLDDDDMYLPSRLEVQYKQMVENDWDVSVMDGATYNFVTGEKVAERHQQVRTGMTKDELIRAHLLYHISGTNSFMYKTSFIQKIGGFDDVPSCQEYILMQKPFILNHLGVVVAIVSATLGNADIQTLQLTAFTDKPEWRAVDGDGMVHEPGLAIELHRFTMEQYDDGLPKRFASDITVYTEDGKTVRGTVEVNKPLKVNGWKIYQYGYDPSRGADSPYSVFQLVRDPWITWVYLGIFLMIAGALCLLFFMAPKPMKQ